VLPTRSPIVKRWARRKKATISTFTEQSNGAGSRTLRMEINKFKFDPEARQ
jgi:hypothetical protein